METPDKIYLGIDDMGSGYVYNLSLDNNGHPEYIRKDALLNWIKAQLAKNEEWREVNPYELLLKELCTRLPYGVICQFIWTYSNETTDGEDVITKRDDIIRCIDICTEEIQANYYGEWVDLKHCKPYLRPMSSMTEEEKEYIKNRWCYEDCEIDAVEAGCFTDWLNSHHFDYRGLIPMGLALEAPKRMYKTQ